jgi:hypothetical protein
MSTDDKMTINERWKYLRRMQKRYLKANRSERSRLLSEMEAVTEQHRKSLIRRMGSDLKRRPRQRQRDRTYGAEVDDALRVIHESRDYICAERLTPELVWMAKHLARHGELRTSDDLLEKLGRISVSTVRRILARIHQDEPRLPRKPPHHAGNSITRDVPMKRIPWSEKQPGRFETDLVYHSGLTVSGEFVCSLQMIDVATGWSERTAVLGRSYLVMKDAFLTILERLPFAVREIHPDNGSEFFNHHLVRFWKDAVQGIRLSRSRPYQKNDNRFVEQKNRTLVRAYLGRDRLDTVDQTRAVNKLYDMMWLYYNFFQPVMRLAEKSVIRQEGQPTLVRRRYDKAKTPFNRLCLTQAITQQQQDQLEALRERTNPRELRRQIYKQIDDIFSLDCASPGSIQDVYETLSHPPNLIREEQDSQFVLACHQSAELRHLTP